MSRLLLVVCLGVSAVGCFTPALEREPSETISEEVRQCPSGSIEDPARCASLRPNGAYCSVDDQCSSGACQGGSCAAKACAAAGSLCGTDESCCGGTFCDDSGYGDPKCRPTRAIGIYCFEDRQCQSNICRQSQCATGCASAGAACSADGDCCTGAVCSSGTCAAAPAANGATCLIAARCQSGNCTNGKCSAPKVANGSSCSTAAQCQSGNCTNGKCAAPAFANGASCTAGNQCQSGNCTNGTCAAPPAANGAACSTGAQCQSGACSGGICAAVCVASGATCSADPDCCGGSFCNNLTYGPWKCSAPQPNGDYCQDDGHCESGRCLNNTCAAAVCGGAGIACSTSADCCGGTFCFNFTYAPWVCKAAQTDGTHCDEDAQCQSARCVGSVCAAAVCTAIGSGCAGDTDCCAGSYCNTPFTYVPVASICTGAKAPGSYCHTHRECLSQSCVDFACAL
jgi:hypothetical protein